MKRVNNHINKGISIDNLNDRLSKISIDNIDYDSLKKEIIEIAEEWWYQQVKEQWMFHKSSYYWRGVSADDGFGCNGAGCAVGCEYYEKEGRLPIPIFSVDEFIASPEKYNPRLFEHIGTLIAQGKI